MHPLAKEAALDLVVKVKSELDRLEFDFDKFEANTMTGYFTETTRFNTEDGWVTVTIAKRDVKHD